MATKVKPSRLQVSGTPQAGQVPVYVDEDTFQWGAGGGGGSGDVSGPSSSTDGDIALFDGATGKIIKDGGKSLTSLESDISANTTAISTINGKIPNAATSSNQLADKNYVNDSINSVTAYYITKDAQGNQWASYAELAAATTFYSGGAVRVPTRNDYTVVLDDETHNNATTRYSYQGSGWQYQYTVHDVPLTQAQLDALNSGITSGKVTSYDSVVATIATYGDIVTHNTSEFATSAQGGLAVTALQPGDNISELNNDAGYLTTAPVTSVNGQTGAVTVNEGITKIFTLSSTSDLTNAQAAYDRLAGGKSPILKYSTYGNSFYVPTYITSTAAYFTRVTGYGSVSSGAWEGVATIKLTLSSGTVTAISHNLNNINISSAAPSSGTTNSNITLVI